jgi:O-antigen/teichoic acid export membrane protein
MKRILDNKLVYYLFVQFFVFIISIIKVPVFTSFFKPEAVGDYALAVSILSYIEIIFLSWISSTFWRFIYEDKIVKGFIHFIALAKPLFAFILSASFLLILGLLYYFRMSPGVFHILIAGYFSIIIQQAVAIYFLYLQAVKQTKKWSLLYLLQQVSAFAIFLLITIKWQTGPVSVYISSLVVNLLFGFAILLYHRKRMPQLFKKSKFALQKQLFSYSYLALGANVLLLILNNADRFLIYHLKGGSDLGRYSQSYSLASVGFSSAIQAFTTFFLPFYNHSIVKTDTPQHNAAIIKLYLILFTPIMVLLILNSSTLTHLFLAPSFQGLHTVFSWVVAGIYCYGLANFFEIRLKLLNQIVRVDVILLAIALLNIVLNWTLLSFTGLVTPAIVTFVSYSVLLTAFIISNQNYMKQLHLSKPFFYVVLVNGCVAVIHFLVHFFAINISNEVLFGVDIIITLILNAILFYRYWDVFQFSYKLTHTVDQGS